MGVQTLGLHYCTLPKMLLWTHNRTDWNKYDINYMPFHWKSKLYFFWHPHIC